MTMRITIITFLLLSFNTLASIIYPQAKKIPQQELRFGHLISDEYKWMENTMDPELWPWIEKQNELTSSLIDTPLVEYFKSKLIEYQKLKDEALDNSVNQELDENKLALRIPFDPTLMRLQKKNYFGKIRFDSNEDEKYNLVFESTRGGDLAFLQIYKKENKEHVKTLIVKFFEKISLVGDELIYISDNDGRTGDSRGKIYKHIIGTERSETQTIYTAQSAYGSLSKFAETTDPKVKYFIETCSLTSRSFYFKLDLTTGEASPYKSLGGDVVLFLSQNQFVIKDFSSANYGELKLINIETNSVELILAEQDFLVTSITNLNKELSLITAVKDAENEMYLYTHKTKELKKINFPSSGRLKFSSASGFDESDADQTKRHIMVDYRSYSDPLSRYKYDFAKETVTRVSGKKAPFEITVVKLHYTAPNGQEAAIWLFKKKSTQLLPSTPLILSGYGGFGVNLLPSLNKPSLGWLEKGGAYAVVTLPGSLVYGSEWYELARRDGRVNSFDSFATAAKVLIEKGYTSSKHIGMVGGSNGGLLIAGTLQRHPDLFAAAVPMVGVLDLYNYSLFGAGKYWIGDFGNPFKESDFLKIKDISPYHNLKEPNYPAVLIMSSEFDDRVHIMH
ncbi:MAG: S9 family peptidase, partial [Halobacteriovoraceae bacterium]|nr:S9 family peptidase [Halobacteriovoraceae bacterium]